MFRCAQDLEQGQRIKKHDCPDCFFCQLCSDSRCRFCRAAGVSRPKMPMAEQIALYESLNAADDLRPDQPLAFRPVTEPGEKNPAAAGFTK